ncbi:MAG: hypothetical protein A3F84_14050 [Candidatus Handelsmanbacteria bacterium RIFCSPLOWO2_12_FULL_64_10]|uniref:Uroporphyrinogen decarboxylase (URO-D) domain-containing protein n=1 Tax=Handelsmanbacteria sp. (strain RIFCSPLOWO2_12_FULL_64_10) TaxID=1817868 RepID=A0A1F6CD32_HANXR|nr:MAG: hypothetical protein A3F84_14050 [Candidatus Handelsmanbacteria bacterium RIFCSPLOWO2_12_FULL_64_10]
MTYKDDWEDAKRRMTAWWEGEVLDRVCLQVTAPKEGARQRPIPEPPDLLTRWTDADYLIEKAQERFRATFYGGEAFPCFVPNFGPDVFSAFLGADLVFAETTSWAETPVVRDWTSPPHCLDPENRWWRRMKGLIETAVERAEGAFVVAVPDTHAGGDALAALRGREALCLDLLDHPDAVRSAMASLERAVIEVYEALYPIVRRPGLGTCGWLPAWSPLRGNVIQCDFLALISPSMAEASGILHDLKVQAAWLDHAIYHLDGPGALPHLDRLLEIPDIRAIQWVPGAGAPPPSGWIPLLRRIQRAGRGLHLSVAPGEVEVLLSELSPEGLMLSASVRSEAEAKDLLRKAAAWTRRGGRG